MKRLVISTFAAVLGMVAVAEGQIVVGTGETFTTNILLR